MPIRARYTPDHPDLQWPAGEEPARWLDTAEYRLIQDFLDQGRWLDGAWAAKLAMESAKGSISRRRFKGLLLFANSRLRPNERVT